MRIFIEEREFRIFLKILNQLPLGAVVVFAENPADMGPEKSGVEWRVDVIHGIRKFMMVAVIRRPPERAFLCRGLREESHEELEYPRSLIRTVREITVISAGDGEHSEIVHSNTESDPLPCKRHEEDSGECNEVEEDERDGPSGVDFTWSLSGLHLPIIFQFWVRACKTTVR